MNKVELKGLKEHLYLHEFSNGLRLCVWENNHLHNNYAAINVNYGSKYYRYKKGNKVITDKTGIAHFLEHVMFQIDKNTNASDIFAKLSSFDNAYTDLSNTCYHITYQDNHQDNLKALIKMVLTPYFTDELVEKEKGIIIEEKRRSLSDPYRTLYYETVRSLYHNANYRESTLGSMEDIKSITKEDLLAVYHEFYNLHNMQLIVCGNCNHEEIFNIVDKLIKDYPNVPYTKKKHYYPKEPITVCKKHNIIEGPVNIPKIKLVYKIPLSNFKGINKREIDKLVSVILKANFSATSDFREKIFSQELVSMFHVSGYRDDDFLIITFSMESNQYEKVIKMIKYRLKHLTVTKEDFASKTHSMLANAITCFENAEAVGDGIVADFARHNKIKPNDVYNTYKIGDKKIPAVIKALNFDNYTLNVLIPQKKQ
ncbi:MAG: insulinase family protein [Bacilli bacterium]|nr:insulinase family protein [Bacilli bacterium]